MQNAIRTFERCYNMINLYMRVGDLSYKATLALRYIILYSHVAISPRITDLFDAYRFVHVEINKRTGFFYKTSRV